MFLFVKIFCQPYRKRVIENKPAFGATQENLKLSLHLVHLYVCPIIFLKKINNKFYGIFLNEQNKQL